MPGNVPAADDHRANDYAAHDHFATGTEIMAAQCPKRENRRDRERQTKLDRGTATDERRHDAGQVRARGAQRGGIETKSVEGIDPPDGEKPLQRHVRGNPKHDQHDQRLEIATAYPDERLAAATRCEGHAESEQQAADNV